MNFFRNLEYKYGKYAIRNLMYYIIMMYLAGILLNLINPMFYYLYLSLDAKAILSGQSRDIFDLSSGVGDFV